MPSVDRVGRYFPLTTALAVAPGQGLFGLAMAAEDTWFGALEEVMLGVLEEDCVTADELAQRLAGLAPLAGEEAGVPPAGPSGDPGSFGEKDICLVRDWKDPGTLAKAAGPLVEILARRLHDDFSFWWTSGSPHVQPVLCLYPGLPDDQRFSTLLRNLP